MPSGGAMGAIWGTSNDHVYVVSRFARYHALSRWDGARWHHILQTKVLQDVWGVSPDDVYAVGAGTAGGAIFHLNGDAYSEVTVGLGPQLNAVNGTAPNDVWACGDGNVVVHWDGSDWFQLPTGLTPQSNCLAVVAASPSDVWFAYEGPVGRRGLLLHYDGVTFTQVLAATHDVASAIGVAGNSVLVGLANGNLTTDDGGTFGYGTSCGTYVRDLLVLSPTSAVAVADFASWCTWDGTAWRRHNAPELGVSALRHVWGLSQQDLWLGADWGELYRMGPDGGFLLSEPTDWHTVQALSANDIWVAGTNTIVKHYDGQHWTAVLARPYGSTILSSFALGPQDVWWGAQDGTVLRWDGQQIRQLLPNADAGWFYGTIRSIWGAAPDDVWLTWAADIALHWDGSVFSQVALPGLGTIYALGGTAANSVYAMTANALFHFDGNLWTQVPGSRGGHEMLVLSDSNIWGSSYEVWHFDGATFSSIATTAFTYGTLVPHGDGVDVLIDYGLISALGTDGGVQLGLGADLYGMSAAPDGTSVLVGSHGTILFKDQ